MWPRSKSRLLYFLMFQNTADKASASLYSLQFQKIVITMKQELAEIRYEITTCVIPEYFIWRTLFT